MLFQKNINKVSILISGFYGFIILRICDCIYIPKYSFPGDPFFQHPSSAGRLKGIISVLIYFSLMIILNYIERRKNKGSFLMFILKNIISFIIGLILFFIIGTLFIPFNCTSGP